MGPVDPVMQAVVEPMIRKAALVMSFNEAWIAIAVLFALSMLTLPLFKRSRIAASPMGPGTGQHLL
jgi:hypothetical protein